MVLEGQPAERGQRGLWCQVSGPAPVFPSSGYPPATTARRQPASQSRGHGHCSLRLQPVAADRSLQGQTVPHLLISSWFGNTIEDVLALEHTLVFIKFRHKQQLLSQTQGHQCHSLISSPKAPKVLPPIMHEHNEE